MNSSKKETAIENKCAGGTRLAPTEAEWRSESAKHKAIRKYHKVKKNN